MRKITLVCLLGLAALAVQAQFTITPKVGVTASTVGRSKAYNDGVEADGGSRPLSIGFSAGVAFAIPVGDIFSIQPEILYTQKGFKEKYDDDYFQSKINYVEIPVLLKFTFGEEDELRFFGYVGPYVGYALNGSIIFKEGGEKNTLKSKFGDEPANYTGDDLYIPTNEVNRLDIGAYIGAGISYPLGPGALSLEGRYGYGFTNFDKDSSGQASKEDLKSQNRTIGVFLGYSIPLGGN